ncbi:MAG: hypothetical protein WA152_00720 [Microgenomates group bacterium]
MEERFYLSNKYKYLASTLLVLMSYRPIVDIFVSNEISFVFVLILGLWVQHIYSWIGPAVVVTSSELILKWIGYGNKKILLNSIKSIETKGDNNIYISYLDNSTVKVQAISSFVIDGNDQLLQVLLSKTQQQ